MCAQCGRTYQWRKSYVKHVKEHMGIYTSTCSLCGKGYGSTRDLNSHINSQHKMEALQGLDSIVSNAPAANAAASNTGSNTAYDPISNIASYAACAGGSETMNRSRKGSISDDIQSGLGDVTSNSATSDIVESSNRIKMKYHLPPIFIPTPTKQPPQSTK